MASLHMCNHYVIICGCTPGLCCCLFVAVVVIRTHWSFPFSLSVQLFTILSIPLSLIHLINTLSILVFAPMQLIKAMPIPFPLPFSVTWHLSNPFSFHSYVYLISPAILFVPISINSFFISPHISSFTTRLTLFTSSSFASLPSLPFSPLPLTCTPHSSVHLTPPPLPYPYS